MNKNERLEKKNLQHKEPNIRRQNQIKNLNEGEKLPNIDTLIADAELKQTAFNSNSDIHKFDVDGIKSISHSSYGKSSRRTYLKELRKVIDASDVLLQILDARDPIGTRITTNFENEILRYHEKRMVLVLNKIDLVPKVAVAGWLMTLRKSHPTVAMKCGTKQSFKNNVGHAKGENALKSTSGVGVEGLISLLKNYSRSLSTSTLAAESANGKRIDNKTCITVGIIGFPNVGKSSLINTLKRRRSLGISPRPGFTKSIQEVVLDQHIRLIDSPGVVFADLNGEICKSDSLIRNYVDIEYIDDPISVIKSLLIRCETESLMMTYSIPSFQNGDVMTFLSLVAKKTGYVRKGGILDKDAVARMIIKDWNSGKVPFYTPPPFVGRTSALVNKDDMSSPLILSGFQDCFDIEKMDTDVLQNLEIDNEMDFVKLKTGI